MMKCHEIMFQSQEQHSSKKISLFLTFKSSLSGCKIR